MICPKCNSKIRDDSKFCSKCGAKCEQIKVNDSEIIEETFIQNEQKGSSVNGWRKLFLILFIADVVFWIIFAATQSGLFGTLGMLFLVLLLAIIAGSLGVDTSKIDDRNEKERRIRRETRIKMDEAKKYSNNWKNTK